LAFFLQLNLKMLIPKKQKFRKAFRKRSSLKGKATSGHKVAFGTYGLKATTAGEVTSRQIESARRAMTRYTKRGGKIWIRIFPHLPVTQKSAEVPMGSGKGSVEFYISPVLPGRVLFEIEGVSEEIAKEAFRLASHKLPVLTKFIEKTHL
jgi:large subunit ribosomal protein L16